MHSGGVASLLAVAFFGVWMAISIAAQLPNLKARIRQFDALYLVPEYSFFAPTPATGDFSLLYRDRDLDGQMGGWRELPIAGRRSILNAFWNPGRRNRKAVFDLCTDLAKYLLADNTPLEVQVSVPYLVLLNHVSRLARVEQAQATQFLIMLSHGVEAKQEPRIMYLSALHGL
jgi:hypothetical protein